MCNFNTKKNSQILLLFLVTFNLFVFKSFSYCFISPNYEVHIINNLPKNSAALKIHCASKDTDFGIHVFQPNQEFYWTFCMNFWATTMYFCHFWWGAKDTSFEVFNMDLTLVCDSMYLPLQKCKWYVKEKGFYLENDHVRRESWP
ncbi:hypothetical protein ABFS83_08G235100 [Erythranthe nasuta]